MTLGLCESIAELPTPPHTQTPCLCLSDSQSESLDQIPNNVAHSTEGKMARVCWKGKRRSKARKKRKKKSSKSPAQAGVALAKPLPRTPEQESCTVPVQVRPPPTPTSMSGSGPAEDLHPDRSSVS